MEKEQVLMRPLRIGSAGRMCSRVDDVIARVVERVQAEMTEAPTTDAEVESWARHARKVAVDQARGVGLTSPQVEEAAEAASLLVAMHAGSRARRTMERDASDAQDEDGSAQADRGTSPNTQSS